MRRKSSDKSLWIEVARRRNSSVPRLLHLEKRSEQIRQCRPSFGVDDHLVELYTEYAKRDPTTAPMFLGEVASTTGGITS
jgi:hypothetical protein